MAIAVIGGLISSTVLTLVFVPAVFVALDDFARLVWRVFGRLVGPTDEPGAPDATRPATGAEPPVALPRHPSVAAAAE